MAVSYNFRKGSSLPSWVWLTQHPVISNVCWSMKYDGSRYIYVVQSSQLTRFDTWTNAWQNLATTTGAAGMDIVYDGTRNCLYIIHASPTTSWSCFNLSNANITISGVVCAPWVLQALTPLLPATAGSGSGISLVGNNLYYQAGLLTGFYRLDVTASPGVWTTLAVLPAASGAGADMDYNAAYDPNKIVRQRGANTNNIYVYDIALGTWSTVTHRPPPLLTFNTGSCGYLSSTGKWLALDDLTTQLWELDLATGVWEGNGNHPYIAGTAIEGKRLLVATSPDEVRSMYVQRAGGQEFFKCPIEWV